jgi:superfamily II DNA or RNA helicase
VAAQRLLLKQHKTYFYARKAALACLHDMGLGALRPARIGHFRAPTRPLRPCTGKTITSILAMGGISQLVPQAEDFKIMVVCPVSVVQTWHDTIVDWTTLNAAQQRVFVCDHQSKLTEKVLEEASVIITTPDTLLQAFKTFMWKDPEAEAYYTKAGKLKYRWGYVRGVDPKNEKRKALFGETLPPIHPLFRYMNKCKATPAPPPEGGWTDEQPQCCKPAFAGVFVDEIHTVSNPKTWTGHILGLICKQAVYTVGLTGTPVRAKPRQVSWLVKVLNVQPEWLQEGKYYSVHGGGENMIRRDTVTAMHNECVDRADSSTIDLQPRTDLKLQFDPFIGRRSNGTHSAKQMARHDTFLLKAQLEAAKMKEDAKYRKKADDYLWQAFSTMTQFCFNATLGTFSAKAFDREPDVFYELAATQPSTQERLVWRMIRDRQSKGHTRIVVFSESAVMLQILRNTVARMGHCGRLFMYTGQLDRKSRDHILREFLHRDTRKGVLFMSRAGAIGTNICPGCDTMFVVGDIPWNNSDLAQAHGRIHRITQDRPVEIVQFEPRRSVTTAKLDAHIDKRDRLEPAMRDEDFSKFSLDNEEQWRLRAEVTLNLTTLDANGNYKKTAEMEDLEEKWRTACDVADAEGREHPPLPDKCNVPLAVLADDIELPPVSYPVEGFVEPESEPEDDGLDPAPDPNRKRKSKKGKRTLEDIASALPSLNGGDETDDEDAAVALLLENTSAKRPELMTEREQEDAGDVVARARRLKQLTQLQENSDDEAFIDDAFEEDEDSEEDFEPSASEDEDADDDEF